MKKKITYLTAVCMFVLVGNAGTNYIEKTKNDPAVKQARQMILMLDDAYQASVNLITEARFPCCDSCCDETFAVPDLTAKGLFAAMKEKGWPESRLINVSGTLSSSENIAHDSFEINAVLALKKGRESFEEIEIREGIRFLRVAMPMPIIANKGARIAGEIAKLQEEGADLPVPLTQEKKNERIVEFAQLFMDGKTTYEQYAAAIHELLAVGGAQDKSQRIEKRKQAMLNELNEETGQNLTFEDLANQVQTEGEPLAAITYLVPIEGN